MSQNTEKQTSIRKILTWVDGNSKKHLSTKLWNQLPMAIIPLRFKNSSAIPSHQLTRDPFSVWARTNRSHSYTNHSPSISTRTQTRRKIYGATKKWTRLTLLRTILSSCKRIKRYPKVRLTSRINKSLQIQMEGYKLSEMSSALSSMCGTSANKSRHRRIISPSTAVDSNHRSMITTEPLKRQRSWVWCQMICSILRRDSLLLTKNCSLLAKSQKFNLTLNRSEFSSESVVTPAWSQVTHETWTKDTSTHKTGTPLTFLMIIFRCLDSNDSMSARSPHKVWWCHTQCSAYKTQAAMLVASTPSVKLHLRKSRYIIINHLEQTIKMSRCIQSTIFLSRMVLSSKVKISNKFSMHREPELAARMQVINRPPT